MIPKLSGVICGNFGCKKNGDNACFGTWHSHCFKQTEDDDFPVPSVNDLDDSLVDEDYLVEEDQDRFNTARDGDHLMTPFQCSDCHFVKMRGRSKIEGYPADDLLFKCIRRATLDSFWARERSTVASNLGKTRRFLQTQEMMGYENLAFPNRGPYLKDDNWGMHVACGILFRSLDLGKNAKNVKFDTIRKSDPCTLIWFTLV